MSEPTALQAVLFALVAAAGTAVALERNPLHQAFISGAFGMLLGVLFLVFQAPDVALSQIVIGAIVLPALVLVALTKGGPNRSSKG